MSDLSSIGPGGHGPVGPVNRLTAPAVHLNGMGKTSMAIELSPSASRLDGDRVEVSNAARFLDMLAGMPDVRLNRVTQVRQAIADGTYESEEKLDLAIERLAEQEL